MNTGTRVRLLDEVGEGVVSGMSSSGMVLVMMSDGFEIPYPANKLVVIGLSEQAPAAIRMEAPVGEQLPESVFLAFTLEGMMKEPTIGFRIINRKKETIFFAVYGEDDRYLKLEGTILLGSGGSKLLFTASLTEMLKRDRFFIQMLPVPAETSIATTYRAGFVKHQIPAMADPAEWQTIGFLAQRGLLFDVEASGKLETAPAYPIKDQADKPKPVKKDWLLKENKDGVFEVDLHIHELLETTSGMENADIIIYQLRHFEKCVDEARQRNLKRFVAIHGIGKGKLKEELVKWLNAENLQHYDASYKNYGFGAMEIRV